MRRLLPGLALAALSLVPGCGGEEPASPATSGVRSAPRLVVLYINCTVNKRYLAPYDESVTYTPHFEAFGREAVVFDNHQTESGLTGTAFASILSGTQADRHQVFRHPRRLEAGLHMVFEAFRDAGFDTYYWIDIAAASSEYHYSQGVPAEHEYAAILRGDDERFRAILQRLETDPDYRALVVSGFTVTHSAYQSDHLGRFLKLHPAERRGLGNRDIQSGVATYLRFVKSFWASYDEAVGALGFDAAQRERLGEVVDLLYRSRVHYLDELFGGVLREIDASPVARETLFAYTADHGETLYRRERPYKWTHGPDLQPEVIGVPFLIRDGTGRLAPGRYDGVTRSIDVYPTVAGLANVPIPAGAVAGVDLSDALLGRSDPPELDAWSHGTLRTLPFVVPDVIERIRVARKRGSLRQRWSPDGETWRFEVFDDATDPDTDVYDPDDPGHRQAAADLWDYRERLVALYHEQNPEAPRTRRERIESLSQRDYEMLRELGYIDESEGLR